MLDSKRRARGSEGRRGGSGDLVIYEVGGGYGTNALAILDYLRAFAPEVYERTRYTIVEIARPLAEKQCERLYARHPGVCQVVNQGVERWAESQRAAGAGEGEEVFILALEVLDNLPHDKVTWCLEGGEWRLHEAVVRSVVLTYPPRALC
jgi:SAM-dependent MidA family methyltransferase